jgi:formylglycine-generating enzyme required for sulfatase activity
MNATRFIALVVVAFFSSTSAHAATIPTVPIGNPGNAPDSTGFGAVGYNYRIGRTEVTNAQYVKFLNGVDPTGANTLALYSTRMSINALGGINLNGNVANGSKYEIKPGRDNNPVVGVSWYDAIRFANWLHNGQGSGDTETGAYTLLGGTPTPSNGDSITRNVGARWWLPNEDEWYKAAYHKNDGATGNYWDYPTSTDAVPFSDQPPGTDAPNPSNTGNFYKSDLTTIGYDDGYAVTGSKSLNSGPNYLTDVGSYSFSPSPYGTFDQGGNVFEWNETPLGRSPRGTRGGSWSGDLVGLLASHRNVGADPPDESVTLGFRVARIPEPSAIAMLGLGTVGPLVVRRRIRAS